MMHKRILSFFICICFALSCVNTIAFADENSQTEALAVYGPQVILKPMDGSFSKVGFELLDESQTGISGAAWFSDNENLYFTDDGCAVISKDTPVGEYTVNALYNGRKYTKTINIFDGMYCDYNDGADGDYFLTGSRSARYRAKGDGDMYVVPDKDFYYVPGIPQKSRSAVEDITFSFDVWSDFANWRGTIGHVQTSCGEWAGNIDFKVQNSKYVFQIMDYTNYFDNGNAGEYKTFESDIDGATWVKIAMKMKSQGVDESGKQKDHKWDIYANGELIFSDVMMRCIGFIRGNGTLITDCIGISNLYACCANDNIEIYSGDKFDPDEDPYIGLKISGIKTLGKPRNNTDVTSVYTLKNFRDENISCDWSISPSESGVSIGSDGTVSVSKNAVAGDYVITASYTGGKKTFNIKIEDVNYKMSIIGTDKIIIDNDFTEKTFEYKAADQFGVEEECDWTVDGDSEFVTVSDGILTVKVGVANGVYKITAVPKDKGSVLNTATFDVTISNVTYSIFGTTEVLKPSASIATAVKYVLKNSLGDEITSGVKWDCSGAEILDDGRVIVLPNTENYTVKAEYGNETYSINAKVSAGKSYDYESYNEGDFLAKDYGEIIRSNTQKNNSKYLYVSYTDSSHRMYVDFGLKGNGEDLTLSYDCFANPGEKFSNSPVICDKEWLGSVGYGCELRDSKYVYTFTCEDFEAEPDEGDVSYKIKSYNIELDDNDWVHVEIVFNTLNNTFDMYLNGIKAMENIRLRFWNQRDFNLTNMLIVGRFDNFSSHSGREYDRKITYTGTKNMPVSEEGISRKQLKYDITDEGILNDSLTATWEIVGFGDDFSGNKDNIKIEKNELVALSPSYGTVNVKATIDGQVLNTGIIGITLSKSFSKLDGMKIIANANEGDKFTVRVYGPKSGSYVKAATEYSTDPTMEKTIITSSDKNATFDIDGSVSGLYYITITNESGDIEDYVIPLNCDKLFEQNDIKSLLSDECINNYLKMYTTNDASVIYKVTDLYTSMTDEMKDTVLKYTNGNISNYFASVLLTSLLSGNKADADMCYSELKKISYDSDDIKLMLSSDSYSDIAKKVFENSSGLESALDNIHVYTILFGVEKYTVSYKEVKSYLAILGSDRYDKASVSDKNEIAKAVGGKHFNSLDELKRAIDNLDLKGNSSSGGSGGSVGSGSSGKTVGSGIMGNVSSADNSTDKDLFYDVSKSHWAYDYIKKLAEKEVLSGYNNYFYPENNITRAEFVKVLVTAFGIEKSNDIFFDDINTNDWYMPYVNGAAKAGLVLGSNGTFNPNSFVTREDACVLIYRFASYAGIILNGDSPLTFNDKDNISSYAADAVGALSANGIINGVGGGMFAPKENATRAAAAKIIYTVINKGGMA